MEVALTGATGFIGSHVLTELQDHGHEVTALVRDDTQADIVKARGATPAVADLYDRPAVAGLLGKTDGAIHTASPRDATSAGLDSALVDGARRGPGGFLPARPGRRLGPRPLRHRQRSEPGRCRPNGGGRGRRRRSGSGARF